jgi:hypothetical protein
MRDFLRTAHGSPKVERLGEEIMHSFNSLVRDRAQNRVALWLIALSLDLNRHRGPSFDRHEPVRWMNGRTRHMADR